MSRGYEECSVLPIPSSVDEWRDEHRTARKRSNRASRFGYEFALSYKGDAARMRSKMLERGYLAGVQACELDKAASPDVVIFAVTAKRTRAEIDAFFNKHLRSR